jgi:hypothetical protein
LLSWVRQWHPDVDPGIGASVGDYLRGFLDEALVGLGLSAAACPPGAPRLRPVAGVDERPRERRAPSAQGWARWFSLARSRRSGTHLCHALEDDVMGEHGDVVAQRHAGDHAVDQPAWGDSDLVARSIDGYRTVEVDRRVEGQ